MRSLVYARDTLSGRTIQHFQARVLRSTARQGVGRGALASLTFGKDDICILSMRYVGRINFKIFWGRMVQTHAYKLAPRPFSIVLAFFSAFFGKTSIFFRFFLKKNC